METSLDYCLRIKDSPTNCSFLCGGDTQVEQEIALVLLPVSSLYERRGDCFGQNEQIFVSVLHRKAKEMTGGNTDRKWCCVYGSVSLCSREAVI